MRPDESIKSQDEGQLVPQRSVADIPPDKSQQAAADILRSQIGNLYNNPQNATTSPVTGQDLDTVNPYDRTHEDATQLQADQWKQYHTAWQTYYQKYYEGYYTHHLASAQKTLEGNNKTGYFSHQPAEEVIKESDFTKEEALFDLRQKLLTKVQHSAKKVRGSRHFIPIAAGVIVMLLFLFLQYNRILISNVEAYISPGSVDSQEIIVNPSANVVVGPENLLIIPKINVTVPTIYDVGTDYDSQMKAMVGGVANFPIVGASSRPGQIGDTVFAGHSSNDIIDVGDYKYIFAKLDKLAVGDTIYINYQSKRYIYTVTRTDIVLPTDVSRLVYPTTKPILTLVTCTPLGTALKRLLVTAEQISPDPTASVAAPAPAVTSQAAASMPGNSPTLFERIFGG